MEISEISPTFQTGLEGGTEVILSGGYFQNSANFSCYFGFIEVPASVISPFEISCISPAVSSPGSYLVTLQVGEISTVDAVNYTYLEMDSTTSYWVSSTDSETETSSAGSETEQNNPIIVNI